MWYLLRRALTLAAALAMTACATTPALPPALCQPGHLALRQLPATVRDDSLKRVLHGEKDKPGADQLAQERQAIDAGAAPRLPRALDQAGLAPLPVTVPAGEDRIGQPPGAAELAQWQAAAPASAYLRWRVTDYGETPVRWAGTYVTVEVVSTLAIGGALYLERSTRPVAGFYVLEEGAEELSEGYAGFWTLNRLSRPVRIEADLIDGQSGAVLWQDSDTGLSPWRWHNLWHMDKARRDALLSDSSQRAASGIAGDFGQALARACGR